jgi:hypothetical protein
MIVSTFPDADGVFATVAVPVLETFGGATMATEHERAEFWMLYVNDWFKIEYCVRHDG